MRNNVMVRKVELYDQRKGYAEEECRHCSMRGGDLCMEMVRMTNLQKIAAVAGNIGVSGGFEDKQNKLAIQIGCKPGQDRI